MDRERGHRDTADTFRLDLSDKDKEYVQDVLDTFLGDACNYKRKLIEIRMSKSMRTKLDISEISSSYTEVPVVVADTGFEDAIEVLLAPLH
jgi:hypothetical protein